KVVEALIRGVPTVTTTVGNEGIHPAGAAFVADDPRAFAASVNRVLRDPDAANDHARRTAHAVAEEYGEERFRARLQEVYR
ncbi:glycosyltransferase, partial [Aquicoccus sp. SCR17]|nr:glycosyltransferase [Carideicomes alvinocaridis]